MPAEDEARAAAGQFRVDHGLGSQPIGDLITVIEQSTGVDVAVVDARPDQHGLTMRDPELNVAFIAVARTRNPMRQRSTLAHELAHVLFEDGEAEGHGGSWAERSPTEIRADTFARHLLLPLDGLGEVLDQGRVLTEADLSAVVQRFLVSPGIAAIALLQGGHIAADTKEAWRLLTARHLAARFGWSDQYRALQVVSDLRRAPQKLLTRAILGYQEGVVSAQAIGQLRGLSAEAVEKELEAEGVVPIDHPIAWASASDLPPVDIDLDELGEEPGPGTVG